MLRYFLAASLALLPIEASASSTIASYLPHKNIERYIVEHFDLGSIRSSRGPSRIPERKTFLQLGFHQKSIKKNFVELEEDGWIFDISVRARGDINKDGVEDIAICLVDNGRGAGGTYLTQTAYLLTQYSEHTPLIAIAYEPDGIGWRAV